MPMVVPTDVEEMVTRFVDSGRFQSIDEVLRQALVALQEQDEDLEAVQLAIDEWKNGDAGIPLNDAFDLVRKNTGHA